jgi:hypothetical protein
MTNHLKRPQHHIPPLPRPDNTWIRTDEQKANTFAQHLSSVFHPYPSQSAPEEEGEILHDLDIQHQMALPLQNIRISEVTDIIHHSTHPSKAPGYDLITGQILKELPPKGIRLLTLIYNATLRLEYFPRSWKIGIILMIMKPGKDPTDVTSYRPISLLPIFSKILEKLLLLRMAPLTAKLHLLPDHQFGFRPTYGTIEQAHRLVHQILDDFQSKRYCTATFLDISQAFDKVRHPELLYKLKRAFRHPLYSILRSYLDNRAFQVKYQSEYTALHVIHSGVPQGSILGPIFYSIFAADLPVSKHTLTATYADNTAILASHSDPAIAAQHLQTHLNAMDKWLKRWRICVNASKSAHIAFSLRRGVAQAVYLDGTLIPSATTVKYLGMHFDRN